MKKTLLFLMLFAPLFANSQIVDGVNLAERLDIDYLEIQGYNMGMFKKRIVVIVDYGQKIKMFDSDTRVEDENGKPIVFNSMIDAVNRFSGWGWELQFAYAVSTGTNGGSIYHYVLRRRK